MSTKTLPCYSSLFFIFSIIVVTSLNGMIVNTSAPSSNSIKIRVERVVQIDIGGAVIISDNLRLSSNTENNVDLLHNFVIGLPSMYQSNLFHYFAYDAVNRLNVTPNVDLEGLYGMDVQFRQAIDLNKIGSYDFRVIHVLSGLVASEVGEFNVSFPLYPIIGTEVESCNVTVILPPGTIYVESEPQFDNTTKIGNQYSFQILNRTEINLEPFANQTSWIAFKQNGLPESFFLMDLDQVVRKITLDPWGNLLVSDFYQIVNEVENLSEIPFILPKNATEIWAQDVYGSLSVSIENEEDEYKRVILSLRQALNKDEKIKLTLNYRLPFKRYVKQNGFDDYTLALDFLNFTRYIARKVTVKVVLPEGAQLQTSTVDDENAFRGESSFLNVTKFHSLNFDLEYRYNIFWASFGPVSWVGIPAAIFSAILSMKRPAKPTRVVVTPIPQETLRNFVNAYEEKMRIRLELKSMERQVTRGKLSRRRYRLRRDTLSNRLSKQQKDLTDLRQNIEAVGGSYADMMRRLEVAEAEVETLGEDIGRVEARYRRRELSAEAYRRLLEEYNRRRERAENTISEVILRLREELH